MRISIGSSLFRLAARVYILRVVFDVSKEDHRILYCVKKLVEMVTAVREYAWQYFVLVMKNANEGMNG